MTNEQRVKARFKTARAIRYRDAAWATYYLIWTMDQHAVGARRLGEGKTAAAAWANAAKKLEMSAVNVSGDIS